MSSVFQRSLIFIALMVAGLTLYSIMFGMKADRYDETAIPYLNQSLPELTSWKYSRLEPLLSPQAKKEFNTEKGQSDFLVFKRLGKLQSFGKPQYQSAGTDNSNEESKFSLVVYTILAEFETGPAKIKINLAINGESYLIHHFSIQSGIFAK